MDEHKPVSDTDAAPESASARPIYIQQINSLIMPGNTEATTKHVALVLGVLAQVRHLAGVEPDEHFEWGMNLIHEWLEATIKFALRHPTVNEVIPVASEMEQGGAS